MTSRRRTLAEPPLDGRTPVFVEVGSLPTLSPGLDLPIGSIARYDSTFVFVKVGAAATAWNSLGTALGTAAGGSLLYGDVTMPAGSLTLDAGSVYASGQIHGDNCATTTVVGDDVAVLGVSGLNGNLMPMICFEARVMCSAAISLILRPNAATTDTSGSTVYFGSGAGGRNDAFWYAGIARGSANRMITLRGVIHCVAGLRRCVWLHGCEYGDTASAYGFVMSGVWNDTSTNLTSLDVYGGSGIAEGSSFSVWTPAEGVTL